MIVRNNLKNMVAFLSFISAVTYAGISIAAEEYSPFASASENTTVAKSSAETSSSKGTAPLISFDNAVLADEHGPLYGAEAQVEELRKMQPIVEHLEKAVQAHNILNSLKNYSDTILRYKEMLQLHQKSIEVLQRSEQCVINYVGRYFNNPIKVWSGIDLRQNPQNHELRKGISAWAMEGFETAKSAQLSPIATDDVSAITSDVIEIKTAVSGMNENELANYVDSQESKKLDIDGNQKQMREFSNAHKGIFFKDPAKQDQYEEDSRKTDLLPIDIGSEASTLMAQDPTKWGSVKKSFPIWNDQRTFYNQYLNGKYDNINEYVKSIEISNEMRKRIYDALSADKETLMVKAEKDIMMAAAKSKEVVEKWYAEEYAKRDKKYNQDLIAVTQKANSDVVAQNTQRDSKIKAIQSEIDANQYNRSGYAAQINDINVANEALSREISDAKNELKNVDAITSGAELTVEQENEHKLLKEKMNAIILASETSINEQNKQKESLYALYDQESEAIDAKEKEKASVLTSYAAKVSEIYKLADDEKASLKKTFEEDLKKLQDERNAKINKISIAAEAAKLTMGVNSTVTVNQINNTTILIIGLAKRDVTKNIFDTRNALGAIGDDLYSGNQHNRVAGYHNALVESLKGKKASFETLDLEPIMAKIPSITTQLSSIISGKELEEDLKTIDKDFAQEAIRNSNIILSVPLFDKVLASVNTTADDDYFVGAEPKVRDFKAPKAMPDFNLPPLREYVRFDYIDLKNAAKNAPKMIVGSDQEYTETILGQLIKKSRFDQTESTPLSVIDKKTFLSYGGKIPEIWKLMLKDKAFVERDFFLSPAMAPNNENVKIDALRLGGEAAALFRGGIYPCILEKVNSDGQSCSLSGVLEGGKGIVDVAIRSKNELHKNEYFLGLGFVSGERRQALSEQNLPVCQGVKAYCKTTISLKDGHPTKTAVPMLVTSKGDSNGSTNVLGAGAYSELGTILALNSGRVGSERAHNLLTLNPQMESLLVYGDRLEVAAKNDQSPEFNADEKINDSVYNTAQFNNNQIGDFLVRVEQEQVYKNVVEELKDSIAEMKEDLFRILKKVGFVPSENFDISKPEDFELTVSKLKSVKQSNMGSANKIISSIEDGGYELLQESKKTYGRLSDALASDKDAVVSMSMTSYDNTALDEKIKTGKANLAVDSKYQEIADKSFEEQLNNFIPAYCVAY